MTPISFSSFFFFNDTATTEIYTLSLHDALPISSSGPPPGGSRSPAARATASPGARAAAHRPRPAARSEEHTSELQSRLHLVCRLLLEKKKLRTNYACRDKSSQQSLRRDRGRSLR